MTFLKPIYRIFAAGALIFNLPVTVSAQIDRNNFNENVSDRDALPLVRIPPIMPTRADRSGHCKVRFDVSPDGTPFNIEAISCSQTLFKLPSVRSVRNWKYNPKIVNGRTVSRSGVETKISFRLTDERGNLIPETVPIAVASSFETDSEPVCRGYSGVIEDHMHYLLTDGDATYIGNMCDGEPDGQGKAMFADGSWYEGTFDEGELTLGRGSYVSDDPDEGSYSGAFKDNEFHGYGTRTYQKDNKTYTYTGHFEVGYKHGQGEIKSSHGEWFKGTFDYSSVQTGKGNLEIEDGVLYKGSFLDGVPHGHGRLELPDQSWFEGNFGMGDYIAGKFYYASDNQIYTGELKDGRPHGEGVLEYNDRAILTDDGVFENGFLKRGRRTFDDGTIHNGLFNSVDLIEGRKEWTDGNWAEGTFKDGFLSEGRRESGKGSWQEGTFKGDKFINGDFFQNRTGQKMWGSIRNGRITGHITVEEDGMKLTGPYHHQTGEYTIETCRYIRSGRSCMPEHTRTNSRNNTDEIVNGITDILNAIILSQ